MALYLLAFAAVLGIARKTDAYSAFTQGARDGLQSAVAILPCLAATLTALRVLESSGLLLKICEALAPLGALMGLPAGALPLALLRPISGSASLGLLSEILRAYGPDSRTGLVASAMMGSGETVFYTCSLYLSAAGVKKSRYIIPASLLGWLAGCVTAGLCFR